jgi:cell division protein FtsQ
VSPARRWRLVRTREHPPGGRRSTPARRRTLRRALAWGTLAVLVLALASWLLLGTSLLGVREVRVDGSRIASADEVRAAAAIAPGTPLARLDVHAVAARVGALPSVARVDVRRSLPHTVLITVTERTPVAVVAGPTGLLVLDATGVVFDEVAAAPPDVVLVRVSDPGPEDPATLAALRVAAALTPPLRAALRELVAESPTRIVLNLVDGRTIRWGDAADSEAKAAVATALLDRAGHTIDVSVPDAATTS